MKTFLEAYFGTTPANEYSKTTAEVFVDPSLQELATIISHSKHKEARLLWDIKEKKMYAWVSEHALHYEVADMLAPNDFKWTQRFLTIAVKRFGPALGADMPFEYLTGFGTTRLGKLYKNKIAWEGDRGEPTEF